jgi:tRNA (cmo5U34)-methyltransferase
VVASSFAIHHLPHPRKRELYQEVWAVPEPGGVFCNLDHVTSPSARVPERFLDALGVAESPILRQLETLDLWLGTLGDEGAQALLAAPHIRKLKSSTSTVTT